jgi:hypothetical protein
LSEKYRRIHAPGGLFVVSLSNQPHRSTFA